MNSFLSGNCDGCYWELSNNIVGCRTCPSGTDSLVQSNAVVTQKIIQKQVRTKASLFTMNFGALTVGNQLNQNQNKYPQNMRKPYIIPKSTTLQNPAGVQIYSQNPSSDRVAPAHSNTNLKFTYVPSHGNSTKSTLTRNRPGASMPGGITREGREKGKGVDVKHNSYARYLARKKSHTIRTQILAVQPVKGNKSRKYGQISQCFDCPNECCQSLDFLITITPPPIGARIDASGSTASGVVINIILGVFPELIIKVDDCNDPFKPSDGGSFTWSFNGTGGSLRGGVIVGGINLGCDELES
jgi:hypothetical protein